MEASAEAGRLRLAVRRVGQSLELSVSDDGRGVAAAQVERVFFGAPSRARALGLLRRRLHGLFGGAFRLEVRSEVGQGTTVTIRMPLRTQSGLEEGARQTLAVSRGQRASR